VILDRLSGNSKSRSNLHIAQIVVVGKLVDEFLLPRKAFYGLLDCLLKLLAAKGVDRIDVKAGTTHGMRRLSLGLFFPPHLSHFTSVQVVECSVSDGSVEIGLYSSFRLTVHPTTPKVAEHVLDDVLRHCGLVHVPHGEGIELIDVGLEEVFEGVPVAFLDLLDPVLIASILLLVSHSS
jgi:hypothetical protein